MLFKRIAVAYRQAFGPLIFTLGFVGLICLADWGVLPDSKHIFAVVSYHFERHGILLVGIAAFIEGIVLLNLYFPGSAIIVLGITSAGGDIRQATLMVASVMLGFFASAQFNYFIGRAGLRPIVIRFGGRRWLERAERWYSHMGQYLVIFAYAHPNLGAFVAVECGNARFTLKRFIAITAISILIWNTIWGLICYFNGHLIRETATNSRLLLGIFAAWTIASFLWGYFRYNLIPPVYEKEQPPQK